MKRGNLALKLNKYSMHIYVYLFYTANASYAPFLSYWFSEQGLSSQEIGLLYSIGPLIGLVAQPLWGLLSDRFGIEKALLMTSLFLTPVVACGFLIANEQFFYYVIFSIFYFLLFSAVKPITESLTVSHARKHGQSYGNIRVLGSISFALAVTPLGLLYNGFGMNTMFLVHLITMGLACLALMLAKKPDISMKKRKAVFTGVRELLTQRYFVFFLICIFLIGIGSHFHNVFFAVYMGRLGGEVAEQIGVLNSISALSELPFFILSAILIRRFGYFPILSITALAGALRWFVLSMDPSYTILMASQLLHGITFALFMAAGVNFVYEISPEGMKTTGQTIFAIVQGNLSNLLASNGGGWIVDTFDFQALFQVGAILSLIAAFGFAIMSFFNKRRIAHSPLSCEPRNEMN